MHDTPISVLLTDYQQHATTMGIQRSSPYAMNSMQQAMEFMASAVAPLLHDDIVTVDAQHHILADHEQSPMLYPPFQPYGKEGYDVRNIAPANSPQISDTNVSLDVHGNPIITVGTGTDPAALSIGEAAALYVMTAVPDSWRRRRRSRG